MKGSGSEGVRPALGRSHLLARVRKEAEKLKQSWLTVTLALTGQWRQAVQLSTYDKKWECEGVHLALLQINGDGCKSYLSHTGKNGPLP